MARRKRLTIAQLRGFKGYENVSDEEADNIIDSLEKIAHVYIRLYQKKKAAMLEQAEKDKNALNNNENEGRNAA